MNPIDKVDHLLGEMTLAEKVGQMTQVELGVVSSGRGGRAEPPTLDDPRLRTAVVDRHVGSILNVVYQAYTPEQWRTTIGRIQEMAGATRLGIPVLYGIDAVHGANYTLGATIFPQNIALAATFRPDLVEKAASVTARETKASAIPWNFAPVLDLGRQPVWPRYYETWGEDVLVTRMMGAAAVRGFQGDGTALDDPRYVAASLKHYVGYSFPLSGKDRTTALIPDRVLRELFLPPFADAIAAGARTVMVNSGDVNGIPVHASHYLLTDVLRGELGFDGVVVSDWEDIRRLHSVHNVADTQRDAVRMSVEAGIDMSMVPCEFSFADHLTALVEDGVISEGRVDESVRRILRLKMELGLFEDPILAGARENDVARASDTALNLEAARAAMTLLKNEGDILPLEADTRILVAGPGAHSLTALNGGWTYTWQGRDSSYKSHYDQALTILEAINDVAGRVTYVPGSMFDGAVDDTERSGVAAAATAAAAADIAIVVVGEDAYAEKPGDIDDLDLPPVQVRLVKEIASTGTPVVLVLTEGRPRIITEIAQAASAILLAYQPGMTGGQAIVDVLFGKTNPSGRLPYSYPLAGNDIVAYDHTNSSAHGQIFGGIGQVRGYEPLFPFGFGLSYTTFRYSDLAVGSTTMGPDDYLSVSVTVENTGSVSGSETVLVYVRDMFASVAPSVRRLRAFDTVHLDPRESQQLTFEIRVRDLAFVGCDNRWVLEAGEFDVQVGDMSVGVTLECEPVRFAIDTVTPLIES